MLFFKPSKLFSSLKGNSLFSVAVSNHSFILPSIFLINTFKLKPCKTEGCYFSICFHHFLEKQLSFQLLLLCSTDFPQYPKNVLTTFCTMLCHFSNWVEVSFTLLLLVFLFFLWKQTLCLQNKFCPSFHTLFVLFFFQQN